MAYTSPRQPAGGTATSDSSPLLSNGSARFGSGSSLASASDPQRSLLLTPPHASLKRTRTLVILGASMCGKTALCERFTHGRFEQAAYEPTYENAFISSVTHRDAPVEVLVRDTQGVGDGTGVQGGGGGAAGTVASGGAEADFRNEYALGVHGYLLAYSVISARSFDVVRATYARLTALIGDRNVPLVLVGCKSDLSAERQVSFDAGSALANSWNAPFLEVSARTGRGVDEAFRSLLDAVDAASEPRPTLSGGVARVLDSICLCLRPSSRSMPHEQAEALAEKWRPRAWTATWACMAIGLALIAAGLWVGWTTDTIPCFSVETASPPPASSAFSSLPSLSPPPLTSTAGRLCFQLLFASGLATSLVALVGVLGLRACRTDLLTMSALAMSALVSLELVAWALLLATTPLIAAHATALSVAGAALVTLQSFAALSASRLASALNSSGIGSPSSHYQLHGESSTHSLYE